jgi:hypothetical protein
LLLSSSKAQARDSYAPSPVRKLGQYENGDNISPVPSLLTTFRCSGPALLRSLNSFFLVEATSYTHVPFSCLFSAPFRLSQRPCLSPARSVHLPNTLFFISRTLFFISQTTFCLADNSRFLFVMPKAQDMDVDNSSLPVTAAQKAAATRARNRALQEEADRQQLRETGEKHHSS